MTPQIVVFDLGKILVDFDYAIACRKFSAQGKLSAKEIQELVDHSPLLFRFETGRMTNEQFYAEICRVTGFSGSYEEFAQIFADIFWPIEPLVQWHAQLCARGVPTFVFSNTNELAVNHIRRSFPFFRHFTGYIYSYQVGAMKPDARIYMALEELAGHQGPEILYLDDRLENVEGGQIRGWQTIHHRTLEETFARLEQLGMA